MLGKRTENPRPILLAEVRDILEKRSAQPDFGYEQQTSLDYTRKFSKIPLDVAHKLAKELAPFEGLHPESAAKIVDILPAHRATLLAIMQKDKSTLTDEETNKVMELVAHARTKIVEEPETPAAAGAPAAEAVPASEAKEEKKEPKEKEGKKSKSDDKKEKAKSEA